MDIIQKIDQIDAEEIKESFKKLIQNYLTPAFGSISKRDFDILLFMELQKLEIFDENPEIYDIVSSLKVTRTKARNLLYESKMRNATPEQLNNELKQLLKSPTFLKDNDKILLEIGNPFLIDHLKAKLKKLGYITDGSFSSELVKLTSDAYLALFEDMLPNEKKDLIKKELIKCGAKEDSSLKGVMSSVIKKLIEKSIGKAGDELVDNAFKYLSPIIEANIENFKNVISELFRD